MRWDAFIETSPRDRTFRAIESLGNHFVCRRSEEGSSSSALAVKKAIDRLKQDRRLLRAYGALKKRLGTVTK